MACATTSGVCEPPGPSKYAVPPDRDGKWARTASTSYVVGVVTKASRWVRRVSSATPWVTMVPGGALGVRPGPCSSAGQSKSLLISRSQVRVLPGALAARRFPRLGGGIGACRGLQPHTSVRTPPQVRSALSRLVSATSHGEPPSACPLHSGHGSLLLTRRSTDSVCTCWSRKIVNHPGGYRLELDGDGQRAGARATPWSRTSSGHRTPNRDLPTGGR